MGTLDGVGSRYDGETPDADDLNELLETLKTLLNGGLPSSTLRWPLVAEGGLDMAGFSIINTASSSGVIHVNGASSFADAVAAVNAANGGVIVLDPGFQASKSADALVISADDVSIVGYGDTSELYFPDMTSAGVGIKVTGDNFSAQNFKVTCASSIANMTEMFVLEGVTGYTIKDITATAPKKALFTLGAGTGDTTRVYDGVVSNLRSSSAATTHIDLVNVDKLSMSALRLGLAGTGCVTFPSASMCRYVTLDGSVLSNTGAPCLTGGPPTVAVTNLDWINITGNIFISSGETAVTLGVQRYMVFDSNVIYGDMPLAGSSVTWSNNVVHGDVAVDLLTHSVLSGGRVLGDFTVGTSNARNTLTGVSLTNSVTFPANAEFDIITNVRCQGALTNLTGSGAELYDNNYALGGIS